jgi:hypothetical protein
MSSTKYIGMDVHKEYFDCRQKFCRQDRDGIGAQLSDHQQRPSMGDDTSESHLSQLGDSL